MPNRRRRFPFVCALALVVVLQTLAVQTHIHLPPTGAGELVQTFGIVVYHHHHPARPTGGGDGDDCPFCQAMLSAGGYLTPATPAILSPLPVAFVRQILPQQSFGKPTPAHRWSSRAPPPHI